jgi:hypothetical protein
VASAEINASNDAPEKIDYRDYRTRDEHVGYRGHRRTLEQALPLRAAGWSP